METSLHRQLKALYCSDQAAQEVTVDGFRIDAVAGDRLIEIQQGSLAALRHKLRALLKRHDVTVVKPLVAQKLLVKRKRAGGAVVSRRYSPKKETAIDLFAELVYLVDVFPHPRLTLEVVLTAQEEHRVPARKRWWKGHDFRVTDRFLVGVEGRVTLCTTADLVRLLPDGLGGLFSTEELAGKARVPRWLAQKMAYCLRKTGACDIVGKRGNAHLYRLAPCAAVDPPRKTRKAS